MKDASLRCYPSGRRLSFLHPTFDQIHIEDMAHHLALLPRYLGGTEKPYNNAQHSWFISMNAEPGFELACLLHDGAEAYTGDLPGPLKHLPGLEPYIDIQHNLQNKIMKKYGVLWTPAIREYVHMLEKRLFVWEEYLTGRGLLPDWDELPEMDTIWSSKMSEEKFLKRFQALYKAPESEFA